MQYSEYDLRYMKERAMSKIRVGKTVAKMTKEDLDALPEYSTSSPTGVFVGKRWKANKNWHKRDATPDWVMYEYQEIPGNDKELRTAVWDVEVIPAYE